MAKGEINMAENAVDFIKENTAKSITGKKALEALETLLENLKANNYIKGYISKYKDKGETIDGKSYGLYAAFIVILANDELWALYDTTSCKTDRLKQQHWDSFLLKRFYPQREGKPISKCYLIYPDGAKIKEIDEFKRNSELLAQIQQGKDALPELDGILSQSELQAAIEHIGFSHEDLGRSLDKRGKAYENFIANMLENSSNLRKWNGEQTDNGLFYANFVKIMTKFGLHGKKIDSISAKSGNSLGRLPSGGMPKTDVLVMVNLKDEGVKSFPISCKKTSAKVVTAHQYSAEAFTKALGITDVKTILLLARFQSFGSVAKMDPEDVKELTKQMPKYNRALAEWVISGLHGEYKSKDQIAKYVITYKEETDPQSSFEIYTVKEYVDKILSPEYLAKGMFGTPFKWTFASKQRGKSIQLKMPVI